jgi:hypothetical protein
MKKKVLMIVLNKYYAKGSPLVDIVFFIERSCAN